MTRTSAPNGNGSPLPSADTEATRRRGVLLVNVGTPDAPDVPAVRRYLAEFLSDPRVIQLPRLMRWMQRPLARFIAWRRSPQSAEKYRLVWTAEGSPLRVIMEQQAAALRAALPKDWLVRVGMRYGQPSIRGALLELMQEGAEELVIVPVYPQFSQHDDGDGGGRGVSRAQARRAAHQR
jgi:ferrochelatase